MNRQHFVFRMFIVCLSLAASSVSFAEPVYKKQDSANGTPFYSSKKMDGNFEEAKLPKINKAEMPVDLAGRETCDGHGGIDCEAGADIDGSVICKDLFRDSAERFNFMCKYASLTVSGLGERVGRELVPVFIRNSKPAAAVNPRVTYTSDLGHTAVLDGPEKIGPYEVGEFKLKSHDAVIIGRKIDQTRFAITCDNCSEAVGKEGVRDIFNEVKNSADALTKKNPGNRENWTDYRSEKQTNRVYDKQMQEYDQKTRADSDWKE